jgi:hypothetical protein
VNKLVLIEWLDIHAGRGWQSMDEIAESCEPLYCRSVGWLVSEKNGHKTIVPHLSGEKNGDILVHGRGDITIPAKAIVNMTVLRHR